MAQQRVVVTRIYGDQEMGASIAGAFESAELKRLQAKLGVRQNRDSGYWKSMIAEARYKYQDNNRPIPRHKQKMWGLIGLATLLFVHPMEDVWN